MAENDHKPQETAENVNTDLRSEENPFDSDGFIGVDPYFQSPALDPKNPDQEKSEKEAETPKAEAPKNPAPAPAAPKAEAPKVAAPAAPKTPLK